MPWRWQANRLYTKAVKDLPIAQDALLSGLLIQVAAACAVVHDIEQHLRSLIEVMQQLVALLTMP